MWQPITISIVVLASCTIAWSIGYALRDSFTRVAWGIPVWLSFILEFVGGGCAVAAAWLSGGDEQYLTIVAILLIAAQVPFLLFIPLEIGRHRAGVTVVIITYTTLYVVACVVYGLSPSAFPLAVILQIAATLQKILDLAWLRAYLRATRPRAEVSYEVSWEWI